MRRRLPTLKHDRILWRIRRWTFKCGLISRCRGRSPASIRWALCDTWVGEFRDELVREVVHLLWDHGHELHPFDQALHFVLAPNFDRKFLLKQLPKLVRPPSGCHDLDPPAHLLDGNTIGSGRAAYEVGNERDEGGYIGGLESLKVDGTTRDVMDSRCALEDRGTQQVGVKRVVIAIDMRFEYEGGESAVTCVR